ncbi:MAG: GTPase HflX [Rhodothermales bacterium]|nr:GTPase HflX [Rhodothermales bacterium]
MSTITKEKAIIVGVIRPEDTAESVNDSLDELELLADTAGAEVTDRMVQRLSRIQSSTYIGKGKVDELKDLVSEHKSDLVLFDDDLSPVQLRNLEKALDCKLVDRSGLILDIFASHARTAVAKTQVELAQLTYLRSRLTRQWTHLSRQKGGIGFKGPGETQIETDRRLIGTRISTLKQKLEKIDLQRQTQRKNRHTFDRVSLVGYTNAGKSTLMNAMAGTDVFSEDQLFATLDATTRVTRLGDGRQVLLSDTVGFIRKLPHGLIESFKSTLDEARESDILLHVVDATRKDIAEQIEVVEETLRDLGIKNKPTLMVFNKIDMRPDAERLAYLKSEYEDAVFVSALRGIGLTELEESLAEMISRDHVDQELTFPASQTKLISRIHDLSTVLDEQYSYEKGSANGSSQATITIRFKTSSRNLSELMIMYDRSQK